MYTYWDQYAHFSYSPHKNPFQMAPHCTPNKNAEKLKWLFNCLIIIEIKMFLLFSFVNFPESA